MSHDQTERPETDENEHEGAENERSRDADDLPAQPEADDAPAGDTDQHSGTGA